MIFAVVRRVPAFILFLVMAISCFTRGMVIVQCQRTAQFYIGAGPETGCDCGQRAAAREVCPLCGEPMAGMLTGPAQQNTEAQAGISTAVFGSAGCFLVVSRGAASPAGDREKTEAPARMPVLVAEAPFMTAASLQARPWLWSGRRELARREGLPAPPGAFRVVLYSALLI